MISPSRPFMARWDRLYLEKVKEAGIGMKLFSRYVDDSNQIAERRNDHESRDEFVSELEKITNTIVDGIQMEVDKCDNYEDKALPILDMKCWLNENGDAVYKHYEKPMASKLVIPERSAHSNSSKRSVHISECLRRIQNTSQKLDWDEYVAPVLSEYMGWRLQ